MKYNVLTEPGRKHRQINVTNLGDVYPLEEHNDQPHSHDHDYIDHRDHLDRDQPAHDFVRKGRKSGACATNSLGSVHPGVSWRTDRRTADSDRHPCELVSLGSNNNPGDTAPTDPQGRAPGPARASSSGGCVVTPRETVPDEISLQVSSAFPGRPWPLGTAPYGYILPWHQPFSALTIPRLLIGPGCLCWLCQHQP